MSNVDYCTPHPSRRHNPVESICRKLQTIQWRGDREPNSPFQIPKLSSSSYDSPQSGLRHNLEAILKKGAVLRDEEERVKGMGMPSSHSSGLGSYVPLSSPKCNPSTPANVTYTITSTLGEMRGADGSDLKHVRTWQRYCSTPTGQSRDSPYFTFTRGPNPAQSESDSQSSSLSPPLSRTFTSRNSILSYNVNFCSADAANSAECELPYPALVVKRLSMGDGALSGMSINSENGRNMAEISLICEENLLDTIFHACDTQRRGKVYVSHIVNYLRHTTSRSSEDSGLEELCNMLDPERKDVSIDLDTYHAVMKEWIDDCRNSREVSAENHIQEDSVKLKDGASARRSMLLNMTSGSLEAFGGEASRVEFETSELVYCVADLQMSNQKLQEEVRKLKQVVESMEESNQKLAEENEDLRNQARLNQQLTQKEKMLKEEVEEMKATLSCTEEGRARASAHSKRMERENQSLIAQISSLQEENFKITMETDELQNKIRELCDFNADLQLQNHSFDAVIGEKESIIVEKNRQINELKAAVEEYSAITELLRKDKNKLETQIQMILPDLAGASMALSVAYRLNQSSLGSLQTELALAQSPLETSAGVNYLSTTMTTASSLDETLDREVLLMLQGPNTEHVAVEYKSLLNKLKRDFKEEATCVLSAVQNMMDNHTKSNSNSDLDLQTVQAELDARRADWAVGLDQLAQYTDSLEKELIKMASKMRRSRTEILHLSVRVQEQENQKRQLCEELEQLKISQDSREASCQTPAPEEEEPDLDWDEEFALQDFLKNDLAERNCWVQDGKRDCSPEEKTDYSPERVEEEDGEKKWTVVDTVGEGEVRDTSTPLSSVCTDVQPDQSISEGRQDFAACTQSEPEVICQPLQKAAAVPLSAHSQAVGITHPEAVALPDLSHSGNSEETSELPEFNSGLPAPALNSPAEQDHSSKPLDSAAAEADMASASDASPGADEKIPKSDSILSTGEDPRQEEEKENELDASAADMSRHKSLSRDPSGDKSAAEDSTSLLPVLVEEEEMVKDDMPDGQALPTSMAAMNQLTSNGPDTSESGSPKSESQIGPNNQSGGGKGSTSSNLPFSQNLAHIMDAVEKNHIQDEPSEISLAPRRQSDSSLTSDSNDVFKDDRNSSSPTDKEIEAEFQRLALGFKCDMFTLEKRLRLEERSRDLAEENVRREVSSCQGLLQALTPLCEDDSQSMEIIQRLQKNLDILIQSMTRVSSRSEMLGAIHQENRIGKAVEVMIQHVENLRRTYTKEHAELLELREALMQSERSFGSQTQKDDFRGKKPPFKYTPERSRRVSMVPIGTFHFDMPRMGQDGPESEVERLTRRSPWNVAGKSMTRPPLKRFVSSAAWVDTEDPPDMTKGPSCSSADCQSDDEPKEAVVEERRRSSLTELGQKLTSLLLPQKTLVKPKEHQQLPEALLSASQMSQDELFVMLPSPSSSPTTTEPGIPQSVSQNLTSSKASAAAVARGSRGLWLWFAIVVVLAGLLALLFSLVTQPAVDAAPVGTGDSWMTIQQLLWPYTGLRHNGQPPV
ncbi:inositol 1,4,5-triphosphate receptor associated 2 isoform X3 [Poecilia formosa]|uniref:inositol 1,4,5-triphosphate receptor associated 2 isoform X3 n=1 Tax=Poecilia formosa TaxID=48698 RepID=UPI0007B79596|nr:PREDICTED: lymphoid-restricted membrane protein-like isoform X3 [Poecilia formosa]